MDDRPTSIWHSPEAHGAETALGHLWAMHRHCYRERGGRHTVVMDMVKDSFRVLGGSVS